MPTETSPLKLTRNAFADLVLTDAEGNVYTGVTPVRMFPFSDPDRYIAILDSQRREVATIDNLAELSEEQRSLILEELSQREFMPDIRRIVSVSAVTEPNEWKVETDRGPTTFVLKSEEDFRRLAPFHYLIVDALGMRYQISDMRKLDAHSRRAMEKYA